MLSALMLRFGFLDRTGIGSAWLAMREALGDDRAMLRVQVATDAALEHLPLDATATLTGATIGASIEVLLIEWTPKLESLSTEHVAPASNPLLDVLIASWRMRTSDALTEESEAAWWAALVAAVGPVEAERRTIAALVGAAENTVRVEADDARHARAIGHEAVRALLRLIDSVSA